ncbi:MAG: Crp/Fnr family transcriptional regulator [Mogibacterium sp.]|nr:Crp/Fnr family transcriptional regulator [Mogibacterium sp.]
MCINSLTVISGLDEARRIQIMDSAIRKKYRKGSYLFREGDPCDGIYLLHTGKIKLCTYDSDGREEIVGIFWAGEIIWEGIFIDGSEYSYDAVCLDTTDCCKIPRQEIESMMEDPHVSLSVIRLLSQKLRAANERVLLLATEDPKARIAGFLLRQSKYARSDTIVMRLEEISASIHLRPETVSRKIKELERDGVITKTGQSSIRILDFQALRDTYKY